MNNERWDEENDLLFLNKKLKEAVDKDLDSCSYQSLIALMKHLKYFEKF